MKAEPLLAVFAGYALKGETVAVGEAMQPYVDEALEEIEYITGDANTKWGLEGGSTQAWQPRVGRNKPAPEPKQIPTSPSATFLATTFLPCETSR